ncbi:peptide chain release factor N(5)-glutamine methyltransferase [Candidatus Galacturonibacter soehngenii]|uniref:Release factor glutamine methyltransferase n=1 Tax=Candidatus Galacturonatibacter soehngenii TaxID=2307010 RepID=A0A7V7QK73_9FIRM|nr:peptide chain release factor N(5)-glutamine methyltransferase [Candidatus Galacturonibacter soehngenii]KAB1438143.1 peptide chain release factor N(5)-glutamine methyltransferase [Candidatus Galacturonibacter soehngenii]
MTLQEALEYGKKYLESRHILDSHIDAWYLLEYVIKADRSYFFLHQKEQMEPEKEQLYITYLKQRGEHIPLQHITKQQEFMGLTFCVNEHVLIPRQDTEILVEEVLKRVRKDMTILDMCTGSGCIIISLKHEKPSIQAFASDISEKALAVARQNAKNLDAPVTFIQSDLFQEINDTFDIIVSNPPYIKTAVVDSLMAEVKEHEPLIALDGSVDGLFFYKEIISKAKRHLNARGFLCFEIGFDQGEDVSSLMKESGFHNVVVIKDLAGLDRVVIGNT